MSDIHELLRSADGGPTGEPDHEAISRRGRQLAARRIAGVAASVVAVVALGGVAVHALTGQEPQPAPVVDEPDEEPEGQEADGLEATDRLEVRPVDEGSWPPEGSASAGTGQAIEIDDDQALTVVIGALLDATAIDPDEVDDEIVEPGYEVTFLADDGEVLARLGYYEHVELWGEHDGRWIDGDQPLAVTQDLPIALPLPSDTTDEAALEGSDAWMQESGMEATDEEIGEGTWIVGYFYPTGEEMAGPDFDAALEPRWKRLSDDVLELEQEELLAHALAALAAAPPTHMSDGWQDPELQLELGTAELDGTELVLDFEQLHAPADGSTHGLAMQAQFEAVAFHYYPEAETICVLENGDPAGWLHDMLGCPSRQLPDE